MAEIVNLGTYRAQAAEKRGFDPWRKRFGETFSLSTRLGDLSDKTLYYLSTPGEESAFAFYELIMGVLGIGFAMKFSYLENKDQMRVMDIHLFLSDQCRFEMMRRLGWVNPLPCGHHFFIDMILQFDRIMSFPGQSSPGLTSNHPEYDNYLKLVDRDREGFIRGLLPAALEEFKKWVSDQ